MSEREYIEHMKNAEICFVCGGAIDVGKNAYKRVDLENAFSRIPFQESRNITYSHPGCEEDAPEKKKKSVGKKDLLDNMLAAITKRIDAMREGEADHDLRSLKYFIEGVFSEAREDYYGNG